MYVEVLQGGQSSFYVQTTLGKAIHWNAPNHIFAVHFILYPPPIFFHIVNVSGIDIHLKLHIPIIAIYMWNF